MNDNENLSDLEELLLLQFYIKNYKYLYPYEKTYTLRRLFEMITQHRGFLGHDLTQKALRAISCLMHS